MRAGGSFVRGLEKPWDSAFTQAMSVTAQKLAEQVQGAQLAYVGSDEITLLLFNNSEKEHFTPFFNGKLQKIVSITAAMATAEFNTNNPSSTVKDAKATIKRFQTDIL